MTEEVGFDQLRTKEQLGYIVFTGAKFAATIMGYRVIIQSEKPTSYLEERVNAFLALFASRLDSMTQEAFEGHKKSLINKRREKVKNLDQESERFWTQITSERFSFVQNEIDAANIKPLTKQDMIDFFTHYIHPTSPARAKLSVHMIAQSTPKPTEADTETDKANNPSKPEQKQQLIAILSEYLTSLNIPTSPDKLTPHFSPLDLTKPNLIPDILTAISTYLTTEAKIPTEQAAAITQQGPQILSAVLPELGIEIPVDEEDLPPAPQVKETVVIEDVFAYKAGLAMSKGPVAVRALKDFEEGGGEVVVNGNGRQEAKL
ncbi:MAG: hypothetical protein Q9204_007385 [Flavoplaca sp. TL-2023a]